MSETNAREASSSGYELRSPPQNGSASNAWENPRVKSGTPAHSLKNLKAILTWPRRKKNADLEVKSNQERLSSSTSQLPKPHWFRGFRSAKTVIPLSVGAGDSHMSIGSASGQNIHLMQPELPELQPAPEEARSSDPLDIAEAWQNRGELNHMLVCLERSAAQGNPAGAYLSGLARTHGWGCVPDERMGMRYFQTSAISLVTALLRCLDEIPHASSTTDARSSTNSRSHSKPSQVAPKVDSVPSTENQDQSASVPAHVHAMNQRITRRSSIESFSACTSGSSHSKLPDQIASLLALPLLELGIAFRNGWGTRTRRHLAFDLVRVAAELDYPDAFDQLAYMYLQGIGTKRNRSLAAHWYRLYESCTGEKTDKPWIHKQKNKSKPQMLVVLSRFRSHDSMLAQSNGPNQPSSHEAAELVEHGQPLTSLSLRTLRDIILDAQSVLSRTEINPIPLSSEATAFILNLVTPPQSPAPSRSQTQSKQKTNHEKQERHSVSSTNELNSVAAADLAIKSSIAPPMKISNASHGLQKHISFWKSKMH